MSAHCNERDGVGTGMRGEGAQVVTNVSVANMVENSIQYSVVKAIVVGDEGLLVTPRCV